MERKAGETITAIDPQTGEMAEARIIKVTRHGWLHVDFGNGVLVRMTETEVQA